jgi:hypothetical protein
VCKRPDIERPGLEWPPGDYMRPFCVSWADEALSGTAIIQHPALPVSTLVVKISAFILISSKLLLLSRLSSRRSTAHLQVGRSRVPRPNTRSSAILGQERGCIT